MFDTSRKYNVCVCSLCAAFFSLLLGVSGAEVQHAELRQ
jgi:hypothetical protein